MHFSPFLTQVKRREDTAAGAHLIILYRTEWKGRGTTAGQDRAGSAVYGTRGKGTEGQKNKGKEENGTEDRRTKEQKKRKRERKTEGQKNRTEDRRTKEQKQVERGTGKRGHADRKKPVNFLQQPWSNLTEPLEQCSSYPVALLRGCWRKFTEGGWELCRNTLNDAVLPPKENIFGILFGRYKKNRYLCNAFRKHGRLAQLV